MDRSEFTAVLAKNVSTIERAMAGDTSGYVYFWPRHCLAVRFDKDNCRAVAADLGTIVKSNSKLVFTNGAGERAVLISREKALCQALTLARTLLANFEMA